MKLDPEKNSPKGESTGVLVLILQLPKSITMHYGLEQKETQQKLPSGHLLSQELGSE